MSTKEKQISYTAWKRLHDNSLFTVSSITTLRQLGVGWVNALIPFAQKLYGVDKNGVTELLKRQNGFFGAHPDFVPLAIGAVAKAEWEVAKEKADPSYAKNLREWCSAALQVHGWQLFRDGFRPLILLLGLIIGLFVYHSSNAMRALAILAFLLCYNLPMWSFRLWSVRYGWRKGLDLPQAFMAWKWHKILWSIRWLGAGMVGVAFVLTAREWGRVVFYLGAHGAEELAWVTAAVGFLLGYILLPRINLHSLLLLLIAVVLAMAWLL